MKKSQVELWQKLGGLIHLMSKEDLEALGAILHLNNGKMTDKALKNMVGQFESALIKK